MQSMQAVSVMGRVTVECIVDVDCESPNNPRIWLSGI